MPRTDANRKYITMPFQVGNGKWYSISSLCFSNLFTPRPADKKSIPVIHNPVPGTQKPACRHRSIESPSSMYGGWDHIMDLLLFPHTAWHETT